jgi:hypothetical protein
MPLEYTPFRLLIRLIVIITRPKNRPNIDRLPDLGQDLQLVWLYNLEAGGEFRAPVHRLRIEVQIGTSTADGWGEGKRISFRYLSINRRKLVVILFSVLGVLCLDV